MVQLYFVTGPPRRPDKTKTKENTASGRGLHGPYPSCSVPFSDMVLGGVWIMNIGRLAISRLANTAQKQHHFGGRSSTQATARRWPLSRRLPAHSTPERFTTPLELVVSPRTQHEKDGTPQKIYIYIYFPLQINENEKEAKAARAMAAAEAGSFWHQQTTTTSAITSAPTTQ